MVTAFDIIFIVFMGLCGIAIIVLMFKYEYLRGYNHGYSKGFRDNLEETVYRLRRERKI